MHHSVFIHLPVEGHFGCLQFWVMMNDYAVNIYIQFLCEYRFLFHWGYYLEVLLLDRMVSVCLTI